MNTMNQTELRSQITIGNDGCAVTTSNPHKSEFEILADKVAFYDQVFAPDTISLSIADKVAYYDRIVTAPDAFSLASSAKLIGTGRTRLCAFMRQIGWLTRYNKPNPDIIESGLLNVKLRRGKHPHHSLRQSSTALVTGKGLAALHEMLSANGRVLR